MAKAVKIWAVYKKWDHTAHGVDEWVCESFDAIEQPSRYRVLKMHQAFHYHTFLRKERVHLTPRAALAQAVKDSTDNVRHAKEHWDESVKSCNDIRALQGKYLYAQFNAEKMQQLQLPNLKS